MSELWKWYVYIIECEDGTYYTGMTWDLAERWEQHLAGSGARYIREHRPKKVVYSEVFENFEQARCREIQIKDWSQAKKRKLIAGEWGRDCD